MKRLTKRPGGSRRFLEANAPATASDFLYHLPTFIADHGIMPVVLHGRVSGYEQRSHLSDISSYLKYEARAYQLKVVGKVERVVPGTRSFESRPDLIEASRIALETGAFILSESACRVIRGEGFHPWLHPDRLPTVPQFAKLMRDVGVYIATALPPDMHWQDVKRHESTVRAGFAKRQPSKVYAELGPIAFAMLDAGASLGEVARELRVAKSTVQGWDERRRTDFAR
jgi:hypothetical protein